MQQERTTVNGDRKEIEQTPTMFLVQSQRRRWGTFLSKPIKDKVA